MPAGDLLREFERIGCVDLDVFQEIESAFRNGRIASRRAGEGENVVDCLKLSLTDSEEYLAQAYVTRSPRSTICPIRMCR